MCRLNPYLSFLILSCFWWISCQTQTSEKKEPTLWHDQHRQLRYKPDGKGFVITNGTKRFNRALYGGNSGFRVEAGDLPEFALYMPRMGGTLRLGLIQGNTSKWLIEAKTITARYEAGKMTYQIEDPLMGSGKLHLNLLALNDADGFVLKIESENIPEDLEIFWGFGGASDKRFSREGDLGADPESSFYLKPEYCTSDEYFISGNSFNLYYGSGRTLTDNEIYENNYQLTPEELKASQLKEKKRLFSLFPEQSEVCLSDATQQDNPIQFFDSEKAAAPAITGRFKCKTGGDYILIINPDTKTRPEYSDLPKVFTRAESARKMIADRIKIDTPDEYINAMGATLSTAADAIWDGQSFMHGAIAWRMPLNGWRGAYAADWLGWHDRAGTHFRGYFKSQYTEPSAGPSEPDPETHLARQKEEVGTALFTSGYISRKPGSINKPHHYDMNQVFISQLLWHFYWTGDLDFLRESWPVLERHLAWEKRCFDADDDGLYDAYASIWASDALQYSGGGVTHSSAYNFRANRLAGELAPLVGKDPAPYLAEAEKIKKAVTNQLWMPEKGWFAEYRDLLGNRLIHPSAAVWTVYHAIDEGLADPFQAYQSTLYIDKNIPHIPVEASGLEASKYYTLSTTNWMPYTWSINNVALAEVLHTALAYWKSGRNDEAFTLAKSSFLDYMFMGSSPGNFGQLSFYDAFRGELYRDFADPIGVASRALVEGLFGISPDMIHQKLTIKPGWPENWEHASIETPDFWLRYKQEGNIDRYEVVSHFSKNVELDLILNARSDQVKSLKVNGKEGNWSCLDSNIGRPAILIKTGKADHFMIEVEWGGSKPEDLMTDEFYAVDDEMNLQLKNASIAAVYDPQEILAETNKTDKSISARLKGDLGWRTFFLQLKQDDLFWWQPVSFELRKPLQINYNKEQPGNKLVFSILNNSSSPFKGSWSLGSMSKNISIPPKSGSAEFVVQNKLVPGSNRIVLKGIGGEFSEKVMNWNISATNDAAFETLDLSHEFNDRITNLFNEQYYSPRSPYATLSIPVQGIGDWCSFSETAEIDDSGVRTKAGKTNTIISPQGIPFSTPREERENILFTSKWDNYPDSVQLTLSGKATHLYLLMAGSMHHMQINMINGWVKIRYTDNTSEVLPLKSPDNWWPIEQDYYEDGFAFQLPAPRPPRLYLKTGEWVLDSYEVLTKNKTKRIEGGAASLLDLPLNPNKELAFLQLITNTNDVVIGLMAATLKRN